MDGYLTVYLPDECLIVFLRKGDAVNAASLHTTGRQVTITEALKRMRSEVERGELAFASRRWLSSRGCTSRAVELQPRRSTPRSPAVLSFIRQER